MISLNVRNVYLLISYSVILANVNPIKTTSNLESEINDAITEYVGQPIRNNETLYKEVYKAIEYVCLQNEYQKLEYRRIEDIISKKKVELYMKEYGIKKELRTFFQALCTFKAGALIDSIEKRLRPRNPKFCLYCKEWGHEKTNCTTGKIYFWDDDEIEQKIRIRKNYWYWTLDHRRDDIDIGRLSDYLEYVYDKTNFTSVFNCEAGQKPANITEFKLLFCLAVGEILQMRDHLKTAFIDWAYSREFFIEKISMNKFIEVFLKALDKWADFEEPAILHCDDNSNENSTTTTTRSGELEISEVIKAFIGEDISSNETLLQEVKNAIRSVLWRKRYLQSVNSIENKNIRKIIKKMEGNHLDLYKTKLKTYFMALCIYRLAATIEKPNIYAYSDEKLPLCSTCLTWNHTADNCNSSEVPLGYNVSISKEVYSWYWMLDNYDFDIRYGIVTLSGLLQEAYDSGNFTNTFEPRPENFRRFKFMCCQALEEIHQYVDNYLVPSYRNEPQLKEFNFYGVPFFKYVVILYKITRIKFPSKKILSQEFNEMYNNFINQYLS